jgi:diketogulonate reductase-like aldo/keto reductase
VSNFGAKHIQEFIDQKVPLPTINQIDLHPFMHIQEFIDQKVPLPTINQIDLHPFMRQPEIFKICEDNGILLEVSVASSAAVLSASSCFRPRQSLMMLS